MVSVFFFALPSPSRLLFYCSYEIGNLEDIGQGKRTDLLVAKDMIDSGNTIKEIWQNERTFSSMVRYSKGLIEYRSIQLGDRDWETEVVVYWGKNKIGKSRRARWEAKQEFGQEEVYSGLIGKWWEGYYGQKAIIS